MDIGELSWRRVSLVLIPLVALELLLFAFGAAIISYRLYYQIAADADYAKQMILVYSEQGNSRKALLFFDLYAYDMKLLKHRLEGDVLKALVRCLKDDTFYKDVVYLGLGFSSKDEMKALDYLKKASYSSDPNVRRLAKIYRAMLLGKKGKEALSEALNEFFSTPDNDVVKFLLGVAFEAIGALGKELTFDKLKEYSKHELSIVRFLSLYVLATFMDYDDEEFYHEFFKDRAPAVRVMAMLAIYYVGPRTLYPDYEVILSSGEESIFKYMAILDIWKLYKEGRLKDKGLLYKLLDKLTRESRRDEVTMRERILLITLLSET